MSRAARRRQRPPRMGGQDSQTGRKRMYMKLIQSHQGKVRIDPDTTCGLTPDSRVETTRLERGHNKTDTTASSLSGEITPAGRGYDSYLDIFVY